MYTVNSNIAALNAQNTAQMHSADLKESLRRLSDGLRIHNSADGPTDLLVANNIRAQETSTNEALKNINNAISMFQVMDSAIDKQLLILDTIKAKAVQASNDSQSQFVRDSLQKEVQELLKEFDKIADETTFNGKKLLDGTFTNAKVQIGAFANDNLDFNIESAQSKSLGHASYQTTYGGSRDINDLSLTFKGAGKSGEDISLAPFNLSHSSGKSLKDLASYVNSKTEVTGIRAVYKEGIKPKPHELNALGKKVSYTLPSSNKVANLIEKKPNDIKLQNDIAIPQVSSWDASQETHKKIKIPSLNDLYKKDEEVKNNKIHLATTQEAENFSDDYSISFRADNPKVIFPRGSTFYEDVDNTGNFTKSYILIRTVDEKFAKNISSSQIKASVGGVPIDLNVGREGDNQISLSIASKPNLADQDNTQKMTIDFSKDALQSKKQLDSATAELEYSSTPSYNLKLLGSLVETSTNRGQVDGTITLEIQGDTFDTLNTAQFNNLSLAPKGAGFALDTLTKTVLNDKVLFDVTGHATNHSKNDDYAVELVNYDNSLSISKTSPKTSQLSAIVDMYDAPTLRIDPAKSFKESRTDDGRISTSIVLKLTNDNFYTNSTPATLKNMFEFKNASGQPLTIANPNIDVSYQVNNKNELTVTFTQPFTSRTDTSLNGVTLNLKPSAIDLFEHFILPAPLAPFNINFITKPQVYVANATAGGFVEDSSNDGSIGNKLTLAIAFIQPNTFSKEVEDQINIENLPKGLTPVYKRIDDNNVEVSILGRAVNSDSRSVANFGFGFRPKAFSTPIEGVRVPANMKFVNNASFKVNGVFKEDASTNRGTITNSITLNSDSDFTNTLNVGDDVTSFFSQVTGVPPGLVANFSILAPKQIEMKLVGNAVNHDNDVDNISFVADGGLFVDNIKSKKVNNISIDFTPKTSVSVEGFMKESSANNGTVNSVVTLTLNSDTLNANVTDALLATKIDIPNLPAGLIPKYTKINDKTIELSFGGAANNHFSYNVEKYISLDFDASLFSISADNVKTSVRAKFLDPLPSMKIAYGNFVESSKNDGSISGDVALKLPIGVELKESVKKEFIDNPILATRKYIKSYDVPYVLKPVVKFDPDLPDLLNITLSGNSIKHNKEDSTKFQLRFSPSMFIDNKVVSNATMPISFYNKPGLSLFGTFRESSFNDGSVVGEKYINVLGTQLNDIDLNDNIQVTGMPLGLYADFKKVNNSIKMTIKGNAKNHSEYNDVYDIGLKFNNALFANGMSVNDVHNIRIDFKDNVKIKLSGSFVESKVNDGSIATSITLKSEKDKISQDLAKPLDKLVKLNGVPYGLTPYITALNRKDIKVELLGKTKFNDSDQLSNITINLSGDIYESKITPEPIENVSILFRDAPRIKAEGDFYESSNDDGSVNGAVTFEVVDDEFEDLSNYGKYIVAYNIPSGLTPKYELIDKTHIAMSLEGAAFSANNSNDVNNVSVQFSNRVFKNRVVPNDKTENISIDFKDSPQIYVSSFFKESSKNDGSIENSIDLNVFGDKVTSVNPNDYIVVENVPEGLKPVFKRLSATKISMSLIGNAINNGAEDDVPNLVLKYKPGLFNNKVPASNTEQVYIDFKNRPNIVPTGSLIENSFNDGGFDESMTINIKGDELLDLSQPLLDRYIQIKDLPLGLSAKFTQLSSSQLEMKILGNAKVHKGTIEPSVIMDEKMFRSGLSPLETKIKNMRFINPSSIELSNGFVESSKNNGSVENTVTLSIKGDEFANVDFDKEIVVSDLPEGLTAKFSKKNNSSLEMRLQGKAVKHTSDFDTGKIKLNFSENILKSKIIADPVTNLSLNFRERPRLDTNSFIESKLNDGSIKNTITFTLHEDLDSFLDIDLDRFISLTNIPLGLTPKFTRIDDKNIKLDLTGKALKHKDEDDVNNVSVSFDGAIFSSGLQAEDIINMVVDFRDPIVPIFEAEDNIFKEDDDNNGKIKNSIELALQGDERLALDIDDSNIEKYVHVDPKTIPRGLKAKINVLSNKMIKVTLEGQSTRHLKKDSVNLKLTFDKEMFESKKRGKDLNDLSISFNNPLISFSNQFKESKKDDGSIGNVVTINLKGDIFNDVDYEKQIKVENIPLGLTPKYKLLNKSQIEMKLEGFAVHHLDEFDVDDLKVKLNGTVVTSGVVEYKKGEKVGVDFQDPLPAIEQAGGPGLYGGYIVFMSERASSLEITAGANTAKFGLDNDYKTTIDLKSSLLTTYNHDELLGSGIQNHPQLLIDQKKKIFGLTDKHSSLVVLDAVDSASEYLKRLRGKIASMQNRLQQTSSRLLVEKTNLKSAESDIREINFAEETALFQKRSIMVQAGNYMLSQANASQKMVLDLLKF